MPSSYNGRGGGGPKKFDGKITDKFRDACPPHKVKDLDALVKQYKGDEAKIQARITEWWEEPAIEEPQWENVGKANKPKETTMTTTSTNNMTSNSGSKSSFEKKEKPVAVGGGAGERSDRGAARGEGRGRDSGRGGGFDRTSRGGGGGRGDGPRKDFGRGAGRGGGIGGRNGDRDRSRGGASTSAAPTVTRTTSSSSNVDANEAREFAEQVLKMANMECPSPTSGIPTPVSNVSALKGAWGTGQSFASVAASTSALKPSPPPVTVAPSAPAHVAHVPAPPNNANASVIEPEEEVPIDLGGPMPSGMLPSSSASSSSAPSANKPTGNVWGSKGGAHLIQAEKKPIHAPPRPPPPAQIPLAEPDEQEPEFSPEPKQQDSTFISLSNVIPPSMNGSNINASGWDSVEQQQQQQQLFVPSPVRAIPTQSIPVQEPVVLPTRQQAAPAAAPTKPNSVLNMGHWETGDGDDELDFGFGSYDNDTEETTKSHSSANASSAPSVPHASPARPPPGLSMPPMPAGAMLVHELENKLEGASLAPKNTDTNNNNGSSDHQANTQASSSQPQLFMNPPGMPQYGGMGMYGIPPPGMHNGLSSSMPPAQFGQLPLDSGLNQLNNSRPGNSPSQLNQAGQPLTQQYSMPSTTSASTNTGAPSSVDIPNGAGGAPGGMPPGMPPTMQGYPSPAYMYTTGGVPGQFNQMGHPAYGMQAAPYGYGQQFAPQGQYGGYNQGLMGQGGGYGAPQHYEDQRGGSRGGNMRDDHQGGGGYNKRDGGRGGYRGNRNQHQNSHPTGYGNNYGPANPNLGYGGMPQYGGYGHGGGYGNSGPAGMDPYAMQQQQQQGGGGYGGGGGFNHQDNDHNKKSLGGVSNHQQAGGFQQQQTHLHQSGLHAGSSNDVGGVGGASGGGWPGARQQQWSGDWQQDS